ncbi:MAG: hypothetical protein RI904_2349 [Pseudomonadota bacterium]
MLRKIIYSLLLCVSCAPSSIDTKQKETRAASQETAAELGVQEVPATLEAMVGRATSSHPSIAGAAASARAAGAEVKAARWQRFPSISADLSLLDESGRTLAPGAVINQPLWTGGRIRGSIDLATAREQAALAEYDKVVLSIAIATNQAFFESHKWRLRSEILSQSLEQYKLLVATIQRRYEREVSPLIDLELARSRALKVEQELNQAQAQETAAASRLRELVGDSFVSIGALPEIPQTWPEFSDEETATKILAFSPALKRIRFDASAAVAEETIARASTLPELSAQSSYSDVSGPSVGIVLRTQLNGGFAKFATANAAAERVKAGELQIFAEERELRAQTVALISEYETSIALLSGNETTEGMVKRVMESYMRQFANGRRTWLDVMNAVREATTAEIDVVEARISAQSSLTQILLLSGQWVPLPSQSVEP